MNGSSAGLLVGSVTNAILDCFNITNNASFGYTNSGTSIVTSYFAGMMWLVQSTTTLIITNYTQATPDYSYNISNAAGVIW
jgi:hypothetical protein